MKRFIIIFLTVFFVASINSYSMDLVVSAGQKGKTEQTGKKKDVRAHVKSRKTRSKKTIKKPRRPPKPKAKKGEKSIII